ncbi:MAG: hypothetical protein ACO330_06685, partial [Aquiluna sp.]
MMELILEFLGWLGYLERPAVILQLLIVATLALSTRLANYRKILKNSSARFLTPIGLILLGLSCLALATFQQPYGLALLLGSFWLGWYSLNLLHRPLTLWLSAEEAHQLESRLLRPCYLLLTATALIRELDSFNDLSAAPLGQ